MLFFAALLVVINWKIEPYISFYGIKLTIFFLLLFKPSLIPWLVVFFISFLSDYCLNMPFGLNFLSILVFSSITIVQKDFLEITTFYVKWVFLGTLLYVIESSTLLLSQYMKNQPLYLPLLLFFSLGVSWLLYPLIALVLTYYFRTLLWLGYRYGAR